MLRIKNVIPNNFVEIDSGIVGSSIGNVKVRSFNKKPTCVNKCLVIILWAYHSCVTSGNELVLEIPLKIENEIDKNRNLKFDMGIFNLSSKKYTGFIEYDGFSSHFTDVKQITNDVLKERFCRTVGVKLLRISPKYEFNITQLDNWFHSNENSISYFSSQDYLERDILIKKLNI